MYKKGDLLDTKEFGRGKVIAIVPSLRDDYVIGYMVEFFNIPDKFRNPRYVSTRELEEFTIPKYITDIIVKHKAYKAIRYKILRALILKEGSPVDLSLRMRYTREYLHKNMSFLRKIGCLGSRKQGVKQIYFIKKD